ncbi:MAG: tetratricopeptide repeat protein [Desulfuromonadales bacterium]|nr:tetratricopeptide repeat protein [Desulfuromonadales bacterium]
MNALLRQLTLRDNICCRARNAILSLLLVFAAGCAPTLDPPDKSIAQGSVVSRLDDGRRGFQIEERADMDGEIRSDFTSAVDLIEQARHDEAIVLLERVIARLSGLTAPHVNIALAYEQKAETEKAEKHLKTALELIPGHPVASNVYGLLLRKNGRFTQARDIFEASLQHFPEYLPVRKNLGILCELYLGDMVGALQQFEIYNEAAPEDEQVMIWIASLRQRITNAE